MKINSLTSRLLLNIWEISKERKLKAFSISKDFPSIKRKLGRKFSIGIKVLKKINFIELVNKSQEKNYCFTKKGIKRIILLKLLISAKKIPINKEWDRQWRIVTFDIPEKERIIRDYFRKLLKQIHFKKYQASVWVSPYKIPNEFRELLFELNLDHWVKIIITDQIDDEKLLKKIFFLK